jgi:L-arabinose isomerase
MSHNRLGVMRHFSSGMLDIYTDLTKQVATSGSHIEIVEAYELSTKCKQLSKKQIKERIACFNEVFAIQTDCCSHELE